MEAISEVATVSPATPLKPTPLRSNSGWSDERVEMLKRLWADGLSASQIAAELGHVTRNAVIGRIHRMGLSGRARQPSRSSEGGQRRTYRPRAIVPRDAMRVDRMLNAEPEFEPEPKPEVILDDAIAVGQRKTVLELNENTCRYPVGNPGAANFFFCGGQTVHGLPYCSGHCRACYQPPKQRRDQHKPHWRQAA